VSDLDQPSTLPRPTTKDKGGTRSAPRQHRPELRQVAVLFADLCDSTRRVARADPEEARHFLDQAIGLMKSSVEAYGGTISQTLGDGVLALFGAPNAHEDYALRACLAAQAIQRGAGEWNSAVDDDKQGMQVRVGIDVGEVIVSHESEFLASHYRADGIAVHVAKRLEQAASPGQTLISGAVCHLVGHQLQTHPKGAFAFQGIDQEVAVHELALQSAVAPLAGQRYAAPLIGRDVLLDQLQAVAEEVRRSGTLRCIALKGEAGAGKSRVIAELCRVESQRGLEVIFTAAHSYTSRVQYALLAELLRELQGRAVHGAVSVGDGDHDLVPEERFVHRAAIDDLLGSGAPDPGWLALTSSQRRRYIREALHGLLSVAARRAPLLLVIEDLMLADRESQRLLEQAMRRCQDLPLLVCVSYRVGFQPSWMDALWFSEHGVRLLEPKEMLSLATAILGDDASLQITKERLVGKAEGNPFYLEQMAMTLIDDGTLVGSPRAYRCATPDARVRIPASIAVVIRCRIDRLPATVKATLEAAAIVGEPLSTPVLASMRRLTEEEVERHLAQASAVGVMSGQDARQGSWVFRHALVSEVIMKGLTRSRRKMLHRAAITALELHGDSALPDESAVLANHAFNGELWLAAARHALVSMTRSIARSANREALAAFDLGMDAARRIEDDQQRATLEVSLLSESLGALLPLGRGEQILKNLDQARLIAGAVKDSRRQAAVLVQLAVMLWTQGRYLQGLDVAHEAGVVAAAAGSRSLQMASAQARVMLNHGLGRYAVALEDIAQVEQAFAPELAAGRMMSGWAVLATVNLNVFLADTLLRLGQLERAQQACDAARSGMEGTEHAFSRTLVDFVQGCLLIETSDPRKSAAYLDEALRHCESRDVATMYPPLFAAWGRARALSDATAAADAATKLQAAIDAKVHLAGGRYNEFYLSYALAVALRRSGRLADAAAAASAAMNYAAAYGQAGHRVEAMYELGQVELARGNADAAASILQRACRLAQESGMERIARLAAHPPGSDPRGITASTVAEA